MCERELTRVFGPATGLWIVCGLCVSVYANVKFFVYGVLCFFKRRWCASACQQTRTHTTPFAIVCRVQFGFVRPAVLLLFLFASKGAKNFRKDEQTSRHQGELWYPSSHHLTHRSAEIERESTRKIPLVSCNSRTHARRTHARSGSFQNKKSR